MSIGLLTAIGDFLLWRATPGLSLGIFVAALAVVLLLNRLPSVRTRPTAAAAVLLLLTAFQTCVEISLSNLLVLAVLLLVLLGETSFAHLRAGFPRWTEALWSVLGAQRSWLWLRAEFGGISFDLRKALQASRVIGSVVLPTAVLGVLFAILLGSGNAIFAHAMSKIVGGFSNYWPCFDLSFGRVALWLLLSTLALALLRPQGLPAAARAWLPTDRPFAAPPDLEMAQWRSIAVLAVLNVLFFAANSIDALYLWIHGTLPVGVSYSQFVHQGVYSLVAAVLLSAFILVLIFQQQATVVESRLIRRLSFIWLAQNVVLIASVLLRLRLYVEAYQLTEQRVYVGCFLLLVATGFALLAWRIAHGRGLAWLVGANAIATFALFFTLQFVDVAKWVASYNVVRWQYDWRRTLDVDYLASLGPSAYPALIAAAETPGRPEAHDAFQAAQQRKQSEQARLASLNWRSWQSRPVGHARELVSHEIRTSRK